MNTSRAARPLRGVTRRQTRVDGSVTFLPQPSGRPQRLAAGQRFPCTPRPNEHGPRGHGPSSNNCPRPSGTRPRGQVLGSDQGYRTASFFPQGAGVTATAQDLVTVTIDERTVQVPKGTGLVETAQAAGIEIPVFCYEPRLGPPVGACRMCLVEVQGMPKLQAGCTLTAQDGMVVRTARSSEQAAEGQNSTLEFILVNHPLDCPVCDKGGECPLQDLTFRYGPGNTRMTFPKRTFEKPIPISPLIALDRERCILCYRCTRFSEDVAEDGQLVAINRGAQSVIATFEDEPYRGHFSGNVTEICPVGALTSTPVPLRRAPVGDPERADRLRPLPRRLQHQRDDARGQGQAHPVAEPPGDRRGLALRQGPLRVRPPARRGPDLRAAPEGRAAPLREALLGRRARPRRAAAARRRHEHRHRLLGRRDGRAGLRPRQAAPAGSRRRRRRAARGRARHARRLARAALGAAQREDDRRAQRRPRRRARADRRAVAQGRPARRRRRSATSARRARSTRSSSTTPRRPRASTRRPSTTCRRPRTAAASPTPGAPRATASPPTSARAC